MSTLAIVLVTIILAASVASAYTTIGTNNRRDTHGWSANRRAVKELDKNFIATHSYYLSPTQYAYQTDQGIEASARYTEGMNKYDLLQKVAQNQPQHLFICTAHHANPNMQSQKLFVGRDDTQWINYFNWNQIETHNDSKFHSALPGSVVLLMARRIAQNEDYTMNTIWNHLKPWILVGPSDEVWRANDNVRFMQRYSSEIVAGESYRKAVNEGLYNAQRRSGRDLSVYARYTTWVYQNDPTTTYSSGDNVYMKLSGERHANAQIQLSKGQKDSFQWIRQTPPIGLSDDEIAGGYLNFHVLNFDSEPMKLNIKISKIDYNSGSTIWDETPTILSFDIYNQNVGGRLYSIFIERPEIITAVLLEFEITHEFSSPATYLQIHNFEFIIVGK